MKAKSSSFYLYCQLLLSKCRTILPRSLFVAGCRTYFQRQHRLTIGQIRCLEAIFIQALVTEEDVNGVTYEPNML